MPLSKQSVTEYRKLYLKGIVDYKDLCRELNISASVATAVLSNKFYSDKDYGLLLNTLNYRDRLPLRLPTEDSYTDVIRSFLSSYSVPIEVKARVLENNLCELTYPGQTVKFINNKEQPNQRYILVTEESNNERKMYLVPFGKYKVRIVIAENRQFFSNFEYKLEDAERVLPIARSPKYLVTENSLIVGLKKSIILSPSIGRDGYKRVSLFDTEGRIYFIGVHRVAAISFVVNPENKPQVNHKDGNKANNHISNLEWNTSQENIVHAFKLGLNTAKKGQASPMAKLTAKDATDIRKWYNIARLSQDKSKTVPSIAKQYAVSVRTIWDILMYIKYPSTQDELLYPKHIAKGGALFRGENTHRSKLSNTQAEEIRARYKQPGVKIKTLAVDYNVSYKVVWRLVKGGTY